MEANKRHRFAQLTLGADFRFDVGNPNTLSYTAPNGDNIQAVLNNQRELSVLIGGTHFWGHADFQIAIPLTSLGNQQFKNGVATSAKYYPWRIQHGKLRPYMGLCWQPAFFKRNEGTRLEMHTFPILAGLTLNTRNHLLNLNLAYRPDNRFSYYISRTEAATVTTSPLLFSVDYRVMLETTLSAEQRWEDGSTKSLTDTLARQKKLNGFTIAVGPSSAIFLKKSTANEQLPYLGQHKASHIFMDAGLGYYLHNPDLHFNLAFRSYKSILTAYGYEQQLRRTSLALEGFKFLFDYHGFAPFAGLAISCEDLKVTERDGDNPVLSNSRRGVYPGITFGWDIRPDRLQAFYLRTNLRYFPGLGLQSPSSGHISFDPLEINFIQLVVFPGRLL